MQISMFRQLTYKVPNHVSCARSSMHLNITLHPSLRIVQLALQDVYGAGTILILESTAT